jgi:hydroxyacylglutathione hydrolase
VDIKRISFSAVNCYLLKSENGFFMVDSGFARDRNAIDAILADAGCRPGDLKLVLLTHGDLDHTGNAAFFRDKYGARVGLHRDEARAAATGNMLRNRGSWHPALRLLAPVARPFFGGRKALVTPDFFLEDGDDLSPHGLDARVLHLPGHTVGSVSVLTSDGDLFCGDLLITHRRVPGKNRLIDDEAVMDASIRKLLVMNIRTVYPGHGRPFPMSSLVFP